MPYKPLTPIEKKRLNRSIKIVTGFFNKQYRTDVDLFAIKVRTRMILKILGNPNPNRVAVAKAILIIKDIWPLKIRRLRKLVNG